MRSGLAGDLVSAPALTALGDPHTPGGSPCPAPHPRVPYSIPVPADPSQFGGVGGAHPVPAQLCSAQPSSRLSRQQGAAGTGAPGRACPGISRAEPCCGGRGHAVSPGTGRCRAGLFVRRGDTGKPWHPTAGTSRAARAFPSRVSGARVARLCLVPLPLGMGPFLGRREAVGTGCTACRGSPAGLGSSAGRAGLEELRGRGGSRARRPARWQLPGAHSTHGKPVGSLGVTHARGAEGCGDRNT